MQEKVCLTFYFKGKFRECKVLQQYQKYLFYTFEYNI